MIGFKSEMDEGQAQRISTNLELIAWIIAANMIRQFAVLCTYTAV